VTSPAAANVSTKHSRQRHLVARGQVSIHAVLSDVAPVFAAAAQGRSCALALPGSVRDRRRLLSWGY